MKAALVLALVGCSSPSGMTGPDAPDEPDAPIEHDAAPDAAMPFGELGGMCGVLDDAELLGAAPALVQGTFTFARAYVDPADRGLLTPGGMTLIATPNAGGSSEMSELFAFEQLARCEQAALLKTETQIVYTDPGGKKTDILVELDGHKVGVSVTRAFAFPIGTPYSEQQATDLLVRKLTDVQAATANASPADAWGKQILSYLVIDDQAAQVVATVWDGLEASVKADTVLLLVTTHGDDLFIYQNQ